MSYCLCQRLNKIGITCGPHVHVQVIFLFKATFLDISILFVLMLKLEHSIQLSGLHDPSPNTFQAFTLTTSIHAPAHTRHFSALPPHGSPLLELHLPPLLHLLKSCPFITEHQTSYTLQKATLIFFKSEIATMPCYSADS